MDGLLAGNGKQGAIVFGNPLDETVVYTDRDFFMARTQANPVRTFNQVTPTDITFIRDQLIAGNYGTANQRAAAVQGYNGGGEGSKHPGYKMVMETEADGDVTDYMRATDYQEGIVYVNWKDDRGAWERETFVSRDQDVTVQYQEAPAGKEFDMSLELSLDSGMHLLNKNLVPSNNSDVEFLNLRVKYPAGRYDAGYEGVTKVITDGSKTMDGDTLKIVDATKVLLLTKTQRYNGTYKSGDPAETEWTAKPLQAELNALVGTDELSEVYESLKTEHTTNHSEIMSRVSLAFNASDADRSKTNEELIAMQKASTTMVPAMYERLFYAGRYHTLGSSYEKAAPDLLGNWTGDADVGWDGYYHLDANLNLQIAGANIGNMPEVMVGYKWLTKQWQEGFTTNASRLLGTRGMLTGGNTPNGEGLISNINAAYPYQYVTGGMSWLLYPIWEEYLVTGNKAILENDYYELIKEMGYFYEDFLLDEYKDSNDKYIFAGSISPESQPNTTGVNNVPLSVNSVYDISGAKFALDTLLRTADILEKPVDATAKAKWEERLNNLPPYIINNDNALAEWAWPDLANKDRYQHRHSSGMMPIWPYQEITAENAPELHAAAKVFLNKKDGGNYENAGHGLLHGAMVAAKLNEDQSVRAKLLRFVRDNYYYDSLGTAHYSTVTPGVFCTDVANSVPTVIMEMLASTTEDTIELLPALPKDLTQGSIKGMLGRSGIKIDDLTWDMTNQTISVTLTSKTTQALTLIQRDGIEEITSNKGAGIITNPDASKIARKISLNANEATTFDLKVKDVSKVNLALDKPATAGSESGTNTKDKAFDGETGTRWGASQNDAQNWIYVDLEDTYAINEVVLRWEDAYSKKYEIQMSKDGTNWKTVHTEDDSDGGVDVITLDNVAGQYVRMQGLEKSGEWGASLWEMEVYGGPRENIALNKPASASSVSGNAANRAADQAFDGDGTTRWGANEPANSWLQVDLQDTYVIDKVFIKWEDSYAKTYKIQTSDDGNVWKDAYTSETKTNANPDSIELTENNIGRYVRMQGVEKSGQWGYSIYEMEVYGEKDGDTPDPEDPDPEDPDPEDPEPIEGDTIYVSKDGSDSGNGSASQPYLTINKAAQMAMPGTTVIVDEGVYREIVKPLRGGEGEDSRITYTVKDGAEVIIKGSEEIDTWVEHEGDVWKAVVPNSTFGAYNPYAIGHPVNGSGATFPGYTCGDVYLDGEAYYQKPSLDVVSRSRSSWFATVAANETTIYANFNGVNPNEKLAEINVRQQVFAPDVWGLGYITVDGFTVMHAANGYSDFPDQPTRRQAGAISVYGGLKWIIQNNTVINARTIGIDIGLSCDMWAGNRPGTVKTDFRNTDEYGSHIVRNNYIAKCGQSGIAGVFSWNSEILYNRIENNNYRGEFSGAETAPIKVHYMNYGLIKGNYIKSSKGGNSAGIWTDWGCQGVRVTGNIVINCPWGYYAEAMHGPVLVDNNIFIGNSNIRTLDATGVVFANNLFYDNGNINVDGNGRNCFYFEPGTMNETEVMSGPVQELFWMNNLVQGSTLPNDRNQITHVKEGNAVGAISNFSYKAEDEMSIKFDLDASGISGLTPVTKDRVGIIPKANESIAADVLTDYFDEAFGEDGLLIGPFADIQAGTNEFTLWPIAGQDTPNPPADVVEKPTNLSLLETSSASATHWDSRNPYEPSKAIDGNGSTRWSSDGVGNQGRKPESITIDLSETYNVSHVVLQWEGAYAAEYKLQASEDGETWVDVLHETQGSGGVETINVNRKARYVRMLGLVTQTQYGFSLYEFEIYGTAIPLENVAINKPATALETTSQDGQTPDKAVDGNNGTRWGGSQNPDNWLQVDLEDFYKIKQVNILWEDSYAKGYKLQVSNDGVTWTDIHTETDGIGGLEEIKSFEPVIARYVRMQGVEMALEWGYSIWEFGVYGVPAESPEQEQTDEQILRVISLIDEIGDVTLDSLEAIIAAETAYEALVALDLNLEGVTNYSTLTAARAAYDALKAEKEAADVVIILIENIGEVSLTQASKDAIETAREAYEALSSTAQELVDNLDDLATAETKYAKLEAEQVEIDDVIALINAIGPVELDESLVAINAAADAYAALSKEQKARVTNATTLMASQLVYKTLEEERDTIALVAEKINAIGTVTEATLVEVKAKIDEARAFYDALKADLKAKVAPADKAALEAAEASYDSLASAKATADQAKATEVEDKITAIGTVELTTDSQAKIVEAKAAYDALSDDQKKLVTNHAVLLAAEIAYENKAEEKDLVNQISAKVVEALINGIGMVEMTEGSKLKIDYARAAYDNLTAEQKALVANVTALEAAATAYETLVSDKAAADKAAADKAAADKAAADKAAADKAAADKAAADKVVADKAAADKKAADAVIAKINAIGKVDTSAASKKKIDDAGAAYNALTADQKKLVTNVNVLNTAQAEYTKQTAPPKKGSTFTVGNFKYKVVKAATATSQGTVQIIGTTNKNITSINIKKTVKSGAYTYKIVSIGNKAFRNLKKLKKVTIGDNVTTIGNDAFSGCPKLTKVTIGKGVTKIGSKAFYNCKKLKNIVIKSTKIKSVGKNAFKGIHNKAKIKVPKSKVKSYQKLFKGKGQKSTVKITK